jgi:predicted nucleic acid-binding protein
MFGRVEIPEAVRDELTAADAPPEVSGLAARPPNWLGVYSVKRESGTELERLQAGEHEAIILAEQSGADLIVLDEKAARRVAATRGLKVTGTLGILKEASERGLIDLTEAIARLRQTTFRASPRLIQNLLKGNS